MANIKVRSNERCNVVVPDFKNEIEAKSAIAEEPRRLKITCRRLKKKDGTGTFNAVTGYVNIEVISDTGKSEGVQVKGLTVHFKKTAFNSAINVHNAEELKSGYLYIKAKGLQVPSVYKITEKKDDDGNIEYDENGEAKLVYPAIWIRSDVIGLEEFVTSQTALDVDKEDDSVDAEYTVNEETGEVSEDYSQYENENVENDSETIIK